MKIGIIGSGVVAQTLGIKLVELGHDVVLGTRDPKKLDEKKNMTGTLNEWLSQVKNKAKVATFKEAAAHGELLINATAGEVSLDALKLAAADKVGAKVLIDVANELDHSKGMPPVVLASHERCLAEKYAKKPVVDANAITNRTKSLAGFFGVSREYAQTHPTTTRKLEIQAGTAINWSGRARCPV